MSNAAARVWATTGLSSLSPFNSLGGKGKRPTSGLAPCPADLSGVRDGASACPTAVSGAAVVAPLSGDALAAVDARTSGV